MIVSNSKYLLGVLNSKVSCYLVSQSAAGRQGGFLEFKPMYLSPIPIPKQPKNETISILVDQIITTKRTNPKADTSALEAQIDKRVYQLYGLTDEEIKIVEKQ